MKKLLPLFTALLLGTAAAHTQITHFTPAAGSSVAAPKLITLVFSEPINLRFSTFKVYALPAGMDAATFAATKVSLKNDADARADAYTGSSSMAARLNLPMKPNLKPGVYVVMWHILSDDGHPVSGQSTFSVK
ncbi:copper resistance protein CopC [Deinococcus rubellus]|uniref:Copper resistance protein CopC n=1 Tax=Deinococcus rubellus TaxID=1889240 RepID=A0ABY5YEB5_9DEIO|nr:copper resistance protein CopC [Deinococcus rubellus]UWX63394.1 copper resistance protein CopC [Deinococcus rubellus]